MNIIGNRDPWEIMHRAHLHILEQMYFMLLMGERFGWQPGMPKMHHDLYEASLIILRCCEAIRTEKKVA